MKGRTVIDSPGMVLASPIILKQEILNVCGSANNLSPSFEGRRLMGCWLTSLSPDPDTGSMSVHLVTGAVISNLLRDSVGEIKKAMGCVGWEGFTSVSPNPRCSGHP